MKFSELKGAELDYLVAKADRKKISNDGTLVMDDPNRKAYLIGREYSPSTNWSQGGPIIEREKIILNVFLVDSEWEACLPPHEYGLLGPTPLIAAMRAYVASKFGEEV